jgi:outer membrane protein insertion porin family
MKPVLDHIYRLFCLVLLLLAFPGFAEAQEAVGEMEGRTIQDVVLMGNFRTKDSVILRELQSKRGRPLEHRVLREDHLRLENLQIFSEVRMWPISVHDGVRLYVDVKERVSWFPLPILYWTHEEGWTYGFGVASINFRGRAEELQGYVAFGGGRGMRLDWYTPWAWRRVFLRVHAERKRTYYRYDQFRPSIHSFGLEVGRPLWRHWRLSVEGRYTVLESDKPGKTVSQDDRDVLPELLASIVYDTRDLQANPHSGWLNALVISQTGKWLEGTTDMTSLTVDSRRYQPLWLGHTLALGIQAKVRAGRIPLYERFHLGGTETVRGWDWNSFQGDNSAIASAEYRFDLARRRIVYGAARSGYVDQGLGGAFFVDTGAVWDVGQEARATVFHPGFGLGLRIFVPLVQVVRLDYAWNRHGQGRWQVNLYPKL